MDIPALPTTLLLLLHLHLLSYPNANNTEFDENIFNAHVRGIRERAKTMEEISYFLVGKIEGNAKAVFPAYPCLRPSDATAFRAALTKYLETLRHAALHPKASTDQLRRLGKTVKQSPSSGTPGVELAWWWKDVMVRKSLLEECSGDKFERLMLALSTHALVKGLDGQSVPSAIDASSMAPKVLQHEMQRYIQLLSCTQSSRRTWERVAGDLWRQHDDIKLLREHLAASGQGSKMKYDNLSTDRLSLLAESRRHDLLKSHWTGTVGQRCLDNAINIAGVRPSDTSAYSLDGPRDLSGSTSENKDNPNQLAIQLAPQSLPIAAAHHPVNVRRLAKSVFDKPKKMAMKANERGGAALQDGETSHSLVRMDEQMDTEKRLQRVLQDALAKTKRVGNEIGEGLKELRKRRKPPVEGISAHRIELWNGPTLDHSAVDFNSTVSSDLLTSLALPPITADNALEDRVRHIRETLLPPFPAIPGSNGGAALDVPLGARGSEDEVSVDNGGQLDHMKSSAGSARTPRRSYVTSTPPKSVKPRLARSQKVTHKETAPVRAKPTPSAKSGKTVRRKSRVSIALARRKTSAQGKEVDMITDDIVNTSTTIQDESDIPIYATPRPRPGSTITLLTRSTVKKTIPPARKLQRDDSETNDLDLSLPEALGIGSEAEWTDDDLVREDSEDDLQYEGNSMSLADILMRAGDTTQFDLLDGGRINLADQSMGWD